jgi:hypothetical protein
MPRKDALAREACLLGIGRRLRTYFNDQESPVSKRFVTLLRQIETGEHGPRGSCGFVAAAVASGNRITPPSSLVIVEPECVGIPIMPTVQYSGKRIKKARQ